MKLRLMTKVLLLAGLLVGFTPVAQAFYNPDTGRWLSRDPLGETGGLNLYGFVRNNPVQFVDTDGRQLSPPLCNTCGQVALWGHRCPSPYPPMNAPDSRLKEIKRYDASCCTAEKIEDGLVELKRRFLLAKDYVDERGLVADPYGDGIGHASCARSNTKFLTFMESTPECWVCFLDRRKDSMFGEQDENFIRCYTKNDIGIQKQIIFDWFEGKIKNEVGIYEGEAMETFEKRHPYSTRDNQKSVPRCEDCSSKYPAWQPNTSILDSFWTEEVDM